MTTIFTNGYLILVEGDNSDKSIWYKAKEWQISEFMKAMEFGTMKSMGMPNKISYSMPFKYDTFNYRFIIENDWGPVYIHNMDSDKKRRIHYFEIGKGSCDNTSEAYISEIINLH